MEMLVRLTGDVAGACSWTRLAAAKGRAQIADMHPYPEIPA